MPSPRIPGGGGSRREPEKPPPAPRTPASRRRRVLKRVALGMAVVLLLAVGGAAYLYVKLNGNIHSSALDLGGTQAPESVNAAGQSAENILLIGSDTRDTAADCSIGGDCGPGANADVEMVLHISADRTNATVMSIPRDTITDVPSCTTPSHTYPAEHDVQINSSLQNGGPGCTVAAVHQLTGITIDHFVMIDFDGVVNLTNDVGGVSVCVSANVYDPDSHLRLTKGDHVISGLTALEFLRTRHAFSDGSDIYRTTAQHMYLSALIRGIENSSTLTDPARLYDVANDATSALTVDPALDSITALVSLGRTLDEIPPDRITFVTMSTEASPLNPSAWVQPQQPEARELFDDIIADTPLSAPPGASASPGTATIAPPTTTPSPAAPSVDPADVAVSVQNGSRIAGRARTVAAALARSGFDAVGDTNAATTAATTLTYPPGGLARARAVAAALHLPPSALKESDHRGSGALVLVVGTDFPSGTTYAGTAGASASASATPSPVSTGPATPPPGTAPENAATTGECAQVNPAYTF